MRSDVCGACGTEPVDFDGRRALNDNQVMHAMHIDDAYRVERVLASGMGGETELVTIEGAGPFVRKKIPEEFARRRVWSALSECECPRLPKVEATYELPDRFVVVYDYVPGDTLEQFLAGRERLSGTLVACFALEICEAASALHSCGVVHRDISPANIIVAKDGAHLVDLGIARMRAEGVSRDTMSLGTWGFASPEQYGFAQTDARSDVYSIGRILGYAITGMRPDEEGYDAVLSDSSLVPAHLKSIIDTACAFEPSARYQSAEALACDLRSFLKAAGFADADAGVDVIRPAGPGGSGNAGNSGELGGAFDSESKMADAAAGKMAGEVSSTSTGATRKRKRVKAFIAAALVFAAVIACVALLAHAGVFASGQDDGGEPGRGQTGNSSHGTLSRLSDALAVVAGSGEGDTAISGTDASASASTAPAGSNASAAFVPSILELAESGWSVSAGGYVHAAFAVRNISSTVAVELPAVQVVGYARDGSVVFSDEQVLSYVAPGQSFYFGGQFGNGVVPETVAFSVVDSLGSSLIKRVDAPKFTVSNVSRIANGIGLVTFTGEVAKENDVSYPTGSDQAIVSLVLRDDEGSIVYGEETFVTLPSAGSHAAFEISLFEKVDFATYEVYACPW